MPTLRAGDSPINISLEVGQALTVTAPVGSSARVFDPSDNSPDSTVSGAATVFGPYAGRQNLRVSCSAGAVSYDTGAPSAPLSPLSADETAAVRALVSGAGIPSAFTSRALTDADNGAALICASSQTATVNAGRVAGFGCSFKGAISFNGTATVNDVRTTGAANPWCALVQIGADTYDAVGGKA